MRRRHRNARAPRCVSRRRVGSRSSRPDGASGAGCRREAPSRRPSRRSPRASRRPSRSSTVRSSCSGRGCWDAVRRNVPKAPDAPSTIWSSAESPDPSTGNRSTAAALITVASRGVLALTPPDVEELSGETVEAAAARTAERLRRALDEAVEARTPGALLRVGRGRRGGVRAGPAGAVGHHACASSRRPPDRRHRRANGRPNRDRRCRRGPRLAAARRGARGRDGAVDRPGSRRDLRHGRLRAATVPLHAALGRIDARVPADDRDEPGSWRRGRHPRAVHRADHLLHRAVCRPADRVLVQRHRARAADAAAGSTRRRRSRRAGC